MGVPYAEVIGDPIAHSKSPLIHKFWLGKLGLEGDYRAVRVMVDGLDDYLTPRRADPDWRGCNVTMPLKQAVLPFLGRLDREAALAGAVNTVIPDGDGARRGFNTDSLAMAELLRRAGRSTHDRHVSIIGTGGAARAAAVGAMRAGYSNLDFEFYGRSEEKAKDLAEEIALTRAHGDSLDKVEGFKNPGNAGKPQRRSDVLINASPLGMTGQPSLEISLDTYFDDTIVLDLVYDPAETPLLKAAREKGLKTIDGLEILVAQAAHAFELFFGVAVPRQHDAELRELLTG